MTTRVLKWPGHVTIPLILQVHPDEQIVMVEQEPHQSDGEFSVWLTDQCASDYDRTQSGWRRAFYVHGTGQPVPDGRKWRGTWREGPFVWHLFEVVA